MQNRYNSNRYLRGYGNAEEQPEHLSNGYAKKIIFFF